MHTELLSGLNEQQRQAVTLPHQSALILAGAGSGKTRVLTTRIAWLISQGDIRPSNILAVTFTNKAAKEMTLRLSAMLPINVKGMWIGTFHGLCNRMLRLHHQEAALPRTFQILDSSDQLSAVKRLMKQMNVDTEKFAPKKVVNFIAAHKEKGQRAHEVQAYDPYSRQMIEIFSEYDQQCQREGVVDFAELLLRCFELLSRHQALREHYQQRFAHILVDEFQDTNDLQYQWLKLLSGRHNALFAVGDDDQSIYAFRGANVANMQALTRDFKIDQVIKLEQNYRSHGAILEAANHLISNNADRLGKNLWTSDEPGEKIRVFEADTDTDEAMLIVDEILQLRREDISLDEIALLYRSNAQSRSLEHALVSAGLPYKVYGGQRFYERQEVKHALAYLRLITNSDDDNALLRIINFPTRGIGLRTQEQLQQQARHHNTSILNAAAQAAAKVKSFVELIDTLRTEIKELSLPDAIARVLELSGLIDHYEKEQAAGKRDAEDRLANLDELINAATTFIHEHEDESLSAFLAHASLEAGEYQADEQQKAIHLMTVHAAKGLEFHSVFITGVEQDLFPHINSHDHPNSMAEERRLMYVAITRARRRLYLSLAHSRLLHGKVNISRPSQFLDELPEEQLQWVGTRSRHINRFQAPAETSTTASTPVPRKTKDNPDIPWKTGQAVHHKKFGRGVITRIDSKGKDVRIEINFKQAGTKLLAMEYAKLEAV